MKTTRGDKKQQQQTEDKLKDIPCSWINIKMNILMVKN